MFRTWRRCPTDILLVGIIQLKLGVVQAGVGGVDVDPPGGRVGGIIRRQIEKRLERDADLWITTSGDAVQIHVVGRYRRRWIIDDGWRGSSKVFSAAGGAECLGR